jgi:negative regulator of flagellin synthesis FlgM
MEINNKSPLIDLSTRASRLDIQEQQAQRLQKTDRGASFSERDRVELSVRSQEMLHIQDLIQSTPDVRQDVVEKVRQSIQNGTYNVKAEQVAEKILGGTLIDQVF